jgi:hypothetical protein
VTALRSHVAFLALFAAAAALRLYALGWLPSPAGDEGNWTLYALRMLQGQPVALAPDAAFVSLLHARLIAVAMTMFGPTFLAARLVGTLAVLGSMVAAYVLLGRLGSWRGGLAAAAVVGFHPWAVFYARTAAVPYALALALLIVGPLVFVAGTLGRRPWVVAVGTIVVSLAIHFSPLALVGAAACGLFVLFPPHRWVLRQSPTWIAAALALAHAAPVLLGAARVAEAAPDLPQLQSFWPHLGGYLHMMGTGLMGEATLRHFTSVALPARPATLLVVPLLAVVVLAVTGPQRPLLGRFAELYFTAGLLFSPLILAPGRNWFLPANHMDRYLFALLPGFALLIAEAAWRNGTARNLAVFATAGWLAVCTGRGAWTYLAGSGVDRGEFIFDGGGGYRGWLVSDRGRATMLRIRDTVLREARGGPGAVLVADRVFIPLVFAMEGTGIPVHDVRRTAVPRRAAGPYFVILWPDEVLSVGRPPTAPPKYVASNQKLRERMRRLFARVQLVDMMRQRDGAPLLEIWRADDPVPKLQLRPSFPRRGRDPEEGETDLEIDPETERDSEAEPR